MFPATQEERALTAERRRFLLRAGSLAGIACVGSSGAAAASDRDLLELLAQRSWLPATPLPVPSGAALSLINAAELKDASESKSAVATADDWWLSTSLGLVQKYRLNPLRASRVLAYVTVTLHDAGLWFQSAEDEVAEFSREVAAGSLLSYLFPEEPKGRWPLDLVRRGRRLGLSARQAMRGWQRGAAIADAAIARALQDGSDPGGAAIQPPANLARPWKATPPLWMSRPIEPLAASWKPWLVGSSMGDAVPAPPSHESAAHKSETVEVVAVQRSLTNAQKKIAEDWDLDLGTVTPAGVWALKLFELPAYRASVASVRTAAMSLLAVTMSDAFAACWKVKYRWWTERPITAVQRDIDPSFMPHVVTPAHPSYVSGHATVSGAAAAVLGKLYPRHAAEFDAMAAEAAQSRLLAGIHFRSDNEQGLALGRRVGEAAADGVLKATRGR